MTEGEWCCVLCWRYASDDVAMRPGARVDFRYRQVINCYHAHPWYEAGGHGPHLADTFRL